MGDLDDIAAAARARQIQGNGPMHNVAPPVPAGTQRVWTVHDRGQQFGPHTESEIASLLGVGTISETALVWREGSPRWIPVTALVPASPRLVPSNVRGSQRAGSLIIPVLISAIGNVLIGFAWASTCFGIVFAIPMWILCVFEFHLYANADNIPPQRLASKMNTLGILEIVVGLCNLVSLICGILTLINASKLTRQEC